MRFVECESPLDDHLDELAVGIIDGIEIGPPELKDKLRPPKLRVVKGAPGINSFCAVGPDGSKTILVGLDLYPFFHQYTRAAAAYFLPQVPGGPRPSSFWSNACSAAATTLDWISSPAASPRYPEFDLTPHQADIAQAFGDYAYRFALCHEIAHVALEHVDTNLSEHRRDDFKALQLLQRQELEADRFGLDLQIKSLQNPLLFVTALSSAVYFVHITGLLDLRLMLLAHLVDYRSWTIEYTHPHALGRIVNLMGAAEKLHGLGDGLRTVHESLNHLDGELGNAANKQQEEVFAEVLKLVSDDDLYVAESGAETTQRQSGSDEVRASSEPSPDVVKRLIQLFDRSPLGALRAMELPSFVATEAPDADTIRVRSQRTERLAQNLPPDFQEFRQLSMTERAKQMV